MSSDDPSSSAGGGFSLGSLGGAGASLGLGALGLGLTLGRGESSLPWQFNTLSNNATNLTSQGNTLYGEGQTFATQGASALDMASKGQLTDPQKAQLAQYTQGLQNQAAQLYAGQGRNINQDTSAISTYADIDAKVNAMAQQQIQTTIQLGLSETQAGASFTSQGLGYENAANQALISAGKAQLENDKDYSDSLTSVFGSIASIAGKVLPAVIAA